MTRAPLDPRTLDSRTGTEIGVSDWIVVDQPRIDAFAAITEDEQFIHVDPARAAASPFGGTIAHGFLTVSMLSRLYATAVPPLKGAAMGVNYGFDSLRFLAPVRAGRRIRGRFTLTGVRPRGAGQVQIGWQVTVEIEGEDRPALVADWLVLAILG